MLKISNVHRRALRKLPFLLREYHRKYVFSMGTARFMRLMNGR